MQPTDAAYPAHRQRHIARTGHTDHTTVARCLHLALAGLVLLGLTACGTSENVGGRACDVDDDCASGFVCQDGRCVEAQTADVVSPDVIDPCGDECVSGQTCCGGECLNLGSDPANCGGCGVECGTNETCEDGKCTCGATQPGQGPACQEPFVCCGSGGDAECVNILTDPDYCGACDVACRVDATCLVGGCQCPVGQRDCGEDGTCDDILASTSNCGSCGNDCGDQACSEGRCTCGVVSCGDGEACCSIQSGGETRFTCVAEASFPNNPNHCGGCAGGDGVKCPPNTICEGGECACGTTGASCADGEVCCGGTECKPESDCLCGGSPCGQTCCSSTCTSTDTDPLNCGACGIACGSGQECLFGECVCTDASLALCDGACVDVNVTEDHCGACGNACAGGETCCDGTCTNTDDSLLHCGGCGQACSGLACVGGSCSCDGMMPTDFQTDPDFCGDCSTSCARPGAAVECVAGSWECVGTNEDCDGDIESNGCEANLSSSTTHCGACGNTCPTGESCTKGECSDPDAIVQVAAGEFFTCARRANQQLLCWGSSLDGRNALNGTDAEVPQVLSGLTVVDVCAGSASGCLVTANGVVYCWGVNSDGQVGNGTTNTQPVPVEVVTSRPAVGVGCGATMACAILDDGTAECWGDNSANQLGDGTSTSKLAPSPVANLTGIVAIDAGLTHTCARTQSGDWWCWGDRRSASVPCGASVTQRVPCQVTSTAPVMDIAVGEKQSYAVDELNQLMGAGKNEAENLLLGGTGSGDVIRTASTVAVATNEADRTVCIIDGMGAVLCWGRGDNGEIGNGTLAGSDTPVPVQGLPSPTADAAVDVSVGHDHACAAVESGKVYCWGKDDGGALGNGPNSGDSSTAVQVVNLP